MAMSRCAKCGGTSFELAEANIKHARFKHYFVQCSSCGAVVSVEPSVNVNYQLEEVKDMLSKIMRIMA
jgi:uncharacterized Zn finger protein